jgi:hypothetical protein
VVYFRTKHTTHFLILSFYNNLTADVEVFMLNEYFGSDLTATEEQRRRLLAVRAALEIALASASSASGASTGGKMFYDMTHAGELVSQLADVIQDALELNDDA